MISTEEIEQSSGRKTFAEFLRNNFKDSDQMLSTFDDLTKLYFEVLAVTNISSIKIVDDVYIKHYLDSVYPYDRFSGSVCDVGCGGGFPTIPLAIVTDLQITGVESVGKKLLLLHRCVSELHLKNLKGDYARSEDLVKLHRSYDTVCARAVADVEKTVSFCAPLTKPNGKIILYRTQSDSPAKPETETKYGIVLDCAEDYVLPGTDIKRRLLIYRKN